MDLRDGGALPVEKSGGESNWPLNVDSAAAFTTFFNNLPGLAWIKDLEGRYVFVNDLTARAFGRESCDILGRTDFELFSPEIAEGFVRNDRLALEAGPSGIRVEETLEEADGLVHYSQVSKFPLYGPEGEPVLVGGTAYDVSERRLAEEKLNAVLASIGDHLVMYDRQWRFTHVNEAAALALQKTREELLGSCIWELFPEAVGNQYYREVHEALESQKVIRSEHYYEPYDKWFQNYIYPRPDGVTVFSSDITWRKKMQQELDRRAEEMTLANRRKDEFLAMLGHELRNPLAPLANSLQLLRLTQGDPAGFERTRDIMDRQVKQLVRLIDDLLDVSRITRGHIDLRIEDADLLEALQRAVESSMPLIEAMGHQLTIEAPSGPILMKADLPRLSQIFTNLLNNAAKYTPYGGQIGLTVTEETDKVSVSVSDTGRGVPPERQSDIFEMFVQLERESHEAQQGLGLGLTLVKRLVELHGGTVACASEGKGKGSLFTVTLKLAGKDQASSQPPIPHEESDVRSERILVVDDNRDAAVSLEFLMRAFGHRVETCFDGLTALKSAESFRPDVVLLDIGLPGLSGYEVARRIRQEPWGSSVLMIAVTGWAQAEDRRRAEEAGFDRHLTKPLDLQTLKELLETWRDGR